MTLTRQTFENINKEYTLEDVINEIGRNNGITGFGAIYYVWRLEDGTVAQLHFSGSDGKINRIHIVKHGVSNELIYNRYDSPK